MACKECIHNGVCHIQEMSTGLEHEEYLREFGCEDFKNESDYAEVKHGEWLLLDDCANEGVYCSVCHKKVYRAEYANQKLKSKFCPNCGADMRGEK